ncbi:hypothetical protein [Flavobacterium panacagri]|nr:hypothetical protein [Flavobacterium panacagri]
MTKKITLLIFKPPADLADLGDKKSAESAKSARKKSRTNFYKLV